MPVELSPVVLDTSTCFQQSCTCAELVSAPIETPAARAFLCLKLLPSVPSTFFQSHSDLHLSSSLLKLRTNRARSAFYTLRRGARLDVICLAVSSSAPAFISSLCDLEFPFHSLREPGLYTICTRHHQEESFCCGLRLFRVSEKTTQKQPITFTFLSCRKFS